jgi:putative CocE/NonD family hydrolase
MDLIVERDVAVPMRDGIVLRADIYRPARQGRPIETRAPAILVRTTYDKERATDTRDAAQFVRAGYVFVIQDVRGRYKSDGCFYHGIYEADDGRDTIDWLAGQPWSNGKVGMTGISYLGAVQCAAAISGTPHLASIFHTKAPSDYYQNGFRHGGAFLMYTLPIALMVASSSKEALADPVLARSLQEAFENASEWLSRMPLKEGFNPVAQVPDAERWLFDMLLRSDYDEFWKNVPLWQPVEFLDRYADVPGMYVGGWYDLYQEDSFYTALAGRKKGPINLLMGPWTHLGFDDFFGDVDFGPTAVLTPDEYFSLQLRWFDRTLKATASDAETEVQPPVRIFVMGGGDGTQTPAGKMQHGGRWRDEHEWPLARADYRAFYFHRGGLLSTELPAASEAATSYVYDPHNPVPTIGGTSYFPKGRNAETGRWNVFVPYGPHDQREKPEYFGCTTSLPLSSRHDVLAFQTPPLVEDIEVTGPLTVKLWVSSSAVDTDFTAKLIDVHPASQDYPDGYAMNLADGIIRARYRNGFERAELLEPEKVYAITFTLFPTSNLFKAGHRIRVDLSSSNYPTYDPNPNTGDACVVGGRSLVAENRIYQDAERPSHIVLPIIGG